MLTSVKPFLSSIRAKILLPALLVIFSFILVINLHWTPNIIKNQIMDTVERERDVLLAISPTITKLILNNNYSELYDSLDHQISMDNHNWLQLTIVSPFGEQLYPLEKKSPLSGQYIKTIDVPLVWDEENVATMSMSFNIEKDVISFQNEVKKLNMLILLIIGLVSIGTLLWQEQTIRRPINKLKKAAKLLEGGQFDVSVSIDNATGEIGDLVNSFDAMRVGLRNANTDLKNAVKIAHSSETRQRSILQNISDAIITINDQGTIDTFNPGAAAIFGYYPQEIIGQNIQILLDDDVTQLYGMVMDNRFQNGTSKNHNISSIAKHKSGKLFPIDISVNEMLIDGKQMFTSIIRDITEELSYKEALIQSKEEAEKASEAKSEFLSRMSHELRTPMNAILGFTQVLEMNENDHLHTDDKLHIKEISKAGHHLLELINEVLDLSRIESGRLELSMEPVHILDVMEDCNILMRSIAKERGISLNFLETPCQNKYVIADRTRMKQVMLNLISNAIKYNKQEGNVSISCEQKNDDAIRITVKDTGIGISKRDQDEMFRPFNRLWAQNSTIQGTGIGLVITKSFIEKMGGKIGLESTLGEGTTFWFELQKTISPEMTTYDGDKITRLSEYNHTKNNKSTILYIEDNPANLRLVSTVLNENKEIQLLSAHEPYLGLEIARTHKPDLILLDINLPMIDGYEVLKILKQNNATSHIPVIAISANAMHSDIKKGHAAGFDDYLPKPIDIYKLQTTVQAYIKKPGENYREKNNNEKTLN
ncbi:MAG: ATP-binding protein [Gammaproteobacteria bacterium]|nr:ATP-binding protein [Gammaproteobacteria bacterium]